MTDASPHAARLSRTPFPLGFARRRAELANTSASHLCDSVGAHDEFHPTHPQFSCVSADVAARCGRRTRTRRHANRVCTRLALHPFRRPERARAVKGVQRLRLRRQAEGIRCRPLPLSTGARPMRVRRSRWKRHERRSSQAPGPTQARARPRRDRPGHVRCRCRRDQRAASGGGRHRPGAGRVGGRCAWRRHCPRQLRRHQHRHSHPASRQAGCEQGGPAQRLPGPHSEPG